MNAPLLENKLIRIFHTLNDNLMNDYGLKFPKEGYFESKEKIRCLLKKNDDDPYFLWSKPIGQVVEVLESDIEFITDNIGNKQCFFHKGNVIYTGHKATALEIIQHHNESKEKSSKKAKLGIVNENPISLSQLQCNDFCKNLLSKLSNVEFFDMFGDLIGFGFDDCGYLPTKHKVYLAVRLPWIGHEIAHMVEVNNDERIFKPDWGFKTWMEEDFDKVQNSALFSAISCEIRVRAIQYHLYNNDSLNTNLNFLYHNHSPWMNAVTKRLPYGRFKDTKDFDEWAQHLFQSTVNKWNKDKIEYEWSRKAELLNNWMATSND